MNIPSVYLQINEYTGTYVEHGGTPVSQITRGPRCRAASGVGSGDPRVRVGGRGSVVPRCLVVWRRYEYMRRQMMRKCATPLQRRPAVLQHCCCMCSQQQQQQQLLIFIRCASPRLVYRYEYHQYMSIYRLVAAPLSML